jgi:hypothetical protein
MSIISDIIGTVIKPVSDLIDGLHTSAEEKLAAQAKMAQIQSDLTVKVLDYEKTLAQEQASVIRAEAQSQSWLTRNWRPILMLTFTVIIAWNYIGVPVFGATAALIPPDMWDLLKIGVGGYVVGRTGEKMVDKWKNGNGSS